MMVTQTLQPQWQPPSVAPVEALLLLVQRWGLLTAAATTLIFGALEAPVAAQATQQARTGATMTIPVNKSQTLRVERAIGKAVIGNDEIADVLPVSLSSIYVLGKATGATNLSLFDKLGNVIAVVDIVVTPDTQGLKLKLAELMPAESVGVSVSNNSIVLGGRIGSAAAAQRAVQIAETYAPKKVINMMAIGTPQQIMLEVRFAETTRGTIKRLGIRSLSFGDTILNTNTNGGFVGPGLQTGNFTGGISIPSIPLTVQIDALEQQGLIRTLAQPNIIALSGEGAYFLAGGEFPVPTGVTQNGQVSVEFKEFGVGLKFTPTLLEDGLINLVVAPEVSSLDPAAGIDINGIRIPGLKVRRAATTLELRDGEAFAMAGLMQSEYTNGNAAIPLLGKLPIIGALFRSTQFNRNETELVMIVTPRVVRPVKANAGKLTDPTDRLQIPDDSELFLLGKTEHRRPVSPALPLPGPPSPANSIKPGGIAGDFGHVVR